MSALSTQVGGDWYKNMRPQPAPVIRSWGLPHLEGEVIYRTLRHKDKGGAEDIKKAIHSLMLILEHDYGTTFSGVEPADNESP